MDPIHVIGVGVRSPFGVGSQALLDGLCAAEPAFRPWQPFIDGGMRYPFAAAVPDACLEMPACPEWWDRGTRLLWGCVQEALSDAGGLPTLASEPTRIGLVVGTSSGGIGPLVEALRERVVPSHANARYDASTAIVARALGLRGPVLTVGAVCASGAMAIAEAASWLQDGFVDAVIAAGFDPLEPFVGAGFDALGATSEQPQPFRAGRRGLVFGEAAAALVLTAKLGSHRSRGVIAGWATSTDAHHLTAPHPEGEGLVVAIERALETSGVDRASVGVINAHGTGTQFNDAMEAVAFRRVFGPGVAALPVHTVKGTIGHSLAAAGAVEAVVSLEALQRRCVPPTCGAAEPDPEVGLDIVSETRASDAEIALSVSAGFGGINAALLLSREPVQASLAAHVRRRVVIRTSSVWIAGRWIESLAELESVVPQPGVEISLGSLASNRKLQRADRTTRLAASAVARAIDSLPEVDARRLAVVSTSAFASAWANEQWELSRLERRRPDPRVFAHTATNAAAGEIAAAIGARGPSLAVIGGECASLVALMRAVRYVETGLAERAVVLAFECPPEHARFVRPDVEHAIECAAALVLEPSDEPGPSFDFRWVDQPRVERQRSALLSVGPLARIAIAARSGARLRLMAQGDAGATLTLALA